MSTKTCSQCKETKDVSCFSVSKKRAKPTWAPKVSAKCKECAARITKEWREKNPERANAAIADWRSRNMERYLSKTVPAAKKYKAENKERLDIARLARYQENKRLGRLPKKKEMTRRQLDVHAERQRVRRFNKRSVGRVSMAEWLDIKDSYLGMCIYCGTKENLTMEHIEPLSRGGLNVYNNVAPACMTCNSSKKAKPLVVWLAKKKLTHMRLS